MNVQVCCKTVSAEHLPDIHISSLSQQQISKSLTMVLAFQEVNMMLQHGQKPEFSKNMTPCWKRESGFGATLHTHYENGVKHHIRCKICYK
jgi:hypothetical protein